MFLGRTSSIVRVKCSGRENGWSCGGGGGVNWGYEFAPNKKRKTNDF